MPIFTNVIRVGFHFIAFILFLHPKLEGILKPKVLKNLMKIQKESFMICLKDAFKKFEKIIIFERERNPI
jgi:hypothetical protein